MDKSLGFLLETFSIYKSPIEEDRIIKEILENFKTKRKGLTKLESKEKGLNIYPKQGINVYTLLNEAKQRNLIVEHDSSSNNKNLLITREGIEYLFNFYSNNRTLEFVKYECSLNQLMSKHGELELNPLQIAYLYWNGHTVQEASSFYLQKSRIRDDIHSYHKHLLRLSDKSVTPEQYVFHVFPKLFVPFDYIDEEVSLRIEGVDTPPNIILTKPYPNQRYICAGIKVGKEITSAGFYPIIAEQHTFPDELNLVFHWSIGASMRIIHNYTIHFDFAEHPGNFFSTEQYLSRNNRLKEFRSTTFVESESELYKDRDVSFSSNLKSNEQTIFERVTLTQFPIQMHSYPYADKNFGKWRERNKITD